MSSGEAGSHTTGVGEDFSHGGIVTHPEKDAVCTSELICYIEQVLHSKFVHSLSVK